MEAQRRFPEELVRWRKWRKPHSDTIAAIRKRNKTINKKTADYFQVVDENFEFKPVEKGILKMMIKTEKGTWASFYPETIFYPGFYS